VNLVASSAIGGDPWMTTASPQPIVGAPLAVGASQDAATASLLSTIESTSTPSSGTTPPGGASNQAQANAQSSYSVFVGPNGSPQATGNWSTATYGYTTGSLTNNNDFTFVSYDTAASINTATNQASFPAGNSIAAASVVAIIGSVQNSGNAVDTITLSSTSNANWTVAFNCYNLSLNSCGASSGAAGTCSTVALPSSQAQNLASQATLKFCAAFTPSAALTALSAIVWTITGTSVGNGTVNNTTYDAVYPGGVLVGFRTYVVSACPGGVTPANQGVISGCTITYTAYLVNEAPTPGAGGSVSVTPSVSAVITENGTATWGVNTGGLTVAPTVASCALCTFTTITLGSKSFTVTVPIADLAPQARPSYTYSVLVN
jgi:hypothetical protein